MQNVISVLADAPAPVREKRLVLRVLEAWRLACTGDLPPKAGEFGAAELGEDAAHVFTIDLSHPAGPRFTSIGAALLVPGLPETAAELSVADCPKDSVLGITARCWYEIVARGVPVTRGGVGRNAGVPVLYRAIMAPLANELGEIAAIIGAANWRAVEGQDGHA